MCNSSCAGWCVLRTLGRLSCVACVAPAGAGRALPTAAPALATPAKQQQQQEQQQQQGEQQVGLVHLQQEELQSVGREWLR